MSQDLTHMTVVELADRIRRKEVSPVEAVEAAIEAIEADNERVNAFVYLGFDEARERARAAERALGSGEELGPLHGVPTAMKDLFDFKPGWPTSFGGVRALKDFRLGHLLRLGRAHGARRGDHRGQDEQSGDGIPGHL